MHSHGARRCDEAGLATLALVLIIPAVVALVAAVAQYVVYYHADHLALAAAQEAVRAAQLADGTEAVAQAQTEDFIDQAGSRLLLDPQVVVSRDEVAQVARAEVRARVPQVLPGFSIVLAARASGPLERFEASGP